MHHEDTLLNGNDIGPAPLQHSHLRAILAIVLRDIMAAVSSADHDDLFACYVVVGCICVLAAVVYCALELRLVFEAGN